MCSGTPTRRPGVPSAPKRSKMLAHAGRGVFLACSALGESIVDAVRRGDLSIVDEIAGVAPSSA